ncbi:loricrin-like [Panicum virgatum]|uniref:loricrin-like n=1 Tax=Panicum virgatum TaxID=38727 RepID=UPI0019D663E6|nr:loricrin-like [Panicum virgatum]
MERGNRRNEDDVNGAQVHVMLIAYRDGHEISGGSARAPRGGSSASDAVTGRDGGVGGAETGEGVGGSETGRGGGRSAVGVGDAETGDGGGSGTGCTRGGGGVRTRVPGDQVARRQARRDSGAGGYVSAGTSWLNGAFSKVAKAGHIAGSRTREKFQLAVTNLTAKLILEIPR